MHSFCSENLKKNKNHTSRYWGFKNVAFRYVLKINTVSNITGRLAFLLVWCFSSPKLVHHEQHLTLTLLIKNSHVGKVFWNWYRVFKPIHHFEGLFWVTEGLAWETRACTAGPLSKALHRICSRGAGSRRTQCSDPNFLTRTRMSLCCNVRDKIQDSSLLNQNSPTQ